MLILPLSLLGADFKAAMLHGNGEVTVNGKNVGSSTTIYVGDTVRTAVNSTATITSSGTIITLDQNSDLSLLTNNIKVLQGHAVVNTKKGIAAQFANLTISPVADRAKFAVIRRRGTYQVAAISGPIMVSDGVHTALVESGNSIAKADDQNVEKTATSEEKRKKKKGIIPGWQLAAVGGGADAAAYFVYHATRSESQQDESQTRPK